MVRKWSKVPISLSYTTSYSLRQVFSRFDHSKLGHELRLLPANVPPGRWQGSGNDRSPTPRCILGHPDESRVISYLSLAHTFRCRAIGLSLVPLLHHLGCHRIRRRLLSLATLVSTIQFNPFGVLGFIRPLSRTAAPPPWLSPHPPPPSLSRDSCFHDSIQPFRCIRVHSASLSYRCSATLAVTASAAAFSAAASAATFSAAAAAAFT